MRNDRVTAAAGVSSGGLQTQCRWLIACLFLILSGFCFPRAAQAASVIAYPLPSVYVEGTSWHITAKGADGITVPLHVRAYEPDAGNGNSTVAYYYCHCSISNSTATAFAVDATQTITSYTISPAGYNITGTLSNGTTTNSVLNFSISTSRYLEIKINSKATLCILADPFESNPPPSSGANIFNMVTQYSADTTGTVSDTSKITQAITDANNYANTNGGNGIVYFPAGVYLSGKITLKSNVALYFAGGAVLYADKSLTWSIGGNHFISTTSGATNVEVYGRGEIDCRGSDIAGYKDPGSNSVPQINPIFSNGASNFQIYGVVCSDSTGFTIQPASGSTDTVIANIKICNRQDWHYNDGIDFTDAGGTSTTPSTVTHCFIRTGDDAACAKSGYFSETGPSAYIQYSDIVADTGFGDGFSVGAETNYDIHDVSANNFQVISCHRGLALIHWTGGGHWYNLSFDSWRVENVAGGETGPVPPGSGTHGGGYYPLCPIHLEVANEGNGEGQISNVTISNMTFDKHGPIASYLWGDPSPNNISGVTFTNVVVTGTHITGFGTFMVNKGNTTGITFN